MSQCISTTKNGSPCRIMTPEGKKYCHIHEAQRQKRLVIVISSFFAFILTGTGILANFSTIGGWLGLSPISFTTKESFPKNLERILRVTDSMRSKLPFLNSLNDAVKVTEQDCKKMGLDSGASKCWILLAQFQQQMGLDFRSALNSMNRAQQMESRIADVYAAKANLYYELALIDIIAKHGFTFGSNDFTGTFLPDKESLNLFDKAREEFETSDKYPRIKDINPEDRVLASTPTVISLRRNQLAALKEGATVVTLLPIENLRLILWIPTIFPKKDPIVEKTMAMGMRFWHYIKAHPDEFPEISLPLLDSEPTR